MLTDNVNKMKVGGLEYFFAAACRGDRSAPNRVSRPPRLSADSGIAMPFHAALQAHVAVDNETFPLPHTGSNRSIKDGIHWEIAWAEKAITLIGAHLEALRFATAKT